MKVLLAMPPLLLMLSCSNLQNAEKGKTSALPQARGTNTDAAISTGRVMVERWEGIEGNKIASLKNSPDFPSRPSSRMFLDKLETIHDIGDNYGTRIRGYIRPPQTGSYVFYITGDNEAQFFLSANESPVLAGDLPVARVAEDQWTGPVEWTKFPSQTSQPISLEAGKRYFFEVLHKEGTGSSDGVAVGWKLPDDQIQRPIPGGSLAPFEVDPIYTSPIPAEAELLDSLTTAHPRLIASDLDFTRVKKLIASNAEAKAAFLAIEGVPLAKDVVIDLSNRKPCFKENTSKLTAEYLVRMPYPCARVYQDSFPRLLDTSREVLRRVSILGMAWKLTDKDEASKNAYAKRAIAEMLAVADPAWGDWNHAKHFMDTAEMTAALAIGYDWFYSVMTEDERIKIATAIETKGLQPALQAYESKSFWTKFIGNWNVVCNGGITLGALAIADRNPQLARKALFQAVSNTKEAGSFATFGPDGAYPEGIAYWGIAMNYLVPYESSLELALGRDFGLGNAPGLAESGQFPLATVGSNNRVFNYGDVGNTWVIPPSEKLHYLAQKYNRPEYAAFAKNNLSGLGLLWYKPELVNAQARPAMDQHFRSVEVAVLRSGFSNDDAYVGFKSGDNKAGHSHLDLGSFVYDAKGVRWAVDIGAEDYAAAGPAYFTESTRRNFYRIRAEGQNTLVINPSVNADQDPTATAQIENFKSNAETASATTNLTKAYQPSGGSQVRRGVKLFKDSQILMIQDEIETAAGSAVWWFMHTDSAVTVDGSTAVLSKNGKRVVAKILSPGDAQFTIREAKPFSTSPAKPAGMDDNIGFRKLSVNLNNFSKGQITILLIPLNAGEEVPTTLPTVSQLTDW